MPLLAIRLPPRERLGSRAPAGLGTPGPQWPALWSCMFSADAQHAGPLRLVPTDHLPKADDVVLVLAESDVSWHSVVLPKAPSSKMHAALAGVLEEQILDDTDQVHFALMPGAQAGQTAWVAVTHRPYLKAALAALAAQGVRVDRVVSALPPPSDSPRGHFSSPEPGALEAMSRQEPGIDGTFAETWPGADESPRCTMSATEGAWHLPLFEAGGEGKADGLVLALRDRLMAAEPAPRWTSTPATARAARWFLGRAVPVQTAGEHLLELATSPVNLLQFDLQAGGRGLKAFKGAGRLLTSPDWRSARRGLATLLVLHVVGLNAYAWQERQTLKSRQSAAVELLRTTFPNVPVVLDAPAQMLAETERLRASAGRPGPADLEVLLSAVAAVWPADKPPLAAIGFQPGRLTLAAQGWRDDEVAAVSQPLRSAGWTVNYAQGALTVTHGAAAQRP